MNKFITSFIFLISNFLNAQVYEWHHSFGGSNWEEASDLLTDEDANIYNLGSFVHSFDADPSAEIFTLTSAGERDVFIRKNDTDGSLIWAKNIGGSGIDNASRMTFDNEGNLLITGYFSGTVDFDPGVGISNATSTGLYDVFVLKLTTEGDFVWKKTFGGTADDYALDIKCAEDDAIYISGAYRETCDFDPGPGVHELTSTGSNDAYVLKLTNEGELIWVNGYGGTSVDGANAMALNNSGGIVVAGRFTGMMDVDPGAGETILTGVASNDCYTLEYSSDGELIWAGSFGSLGYDGIGDIIRDSEGNYTIVGFFGGTTDFDMGDGITELTAVGTNDIFVLKIASDGEYIWAHGFGQDEESEGRGVAVDLADNIYVTGYFSGVVDFDPGVDIFEIASESSSDSFILKLDKDGNFLNALTISGTANTIGSKITIDPENSIYTIGRHSGTTDFDPSDEIVTSTSSAGSFDFYLLKIGQDPICLPTAGSFTTSTCNSFESPSGLYTWTSSGIYTDTLINASGCDSIVTVNLTINYDITSELTLSTCETYTSPSGLYTWTESGIYNDTLTAESGCDSLLTINLIINNSTSSTLTEESCGSYISPSGDYTWTNTGIYYDTLVNLVGCDSIITVNLTINTVNTDVELDGITLTSGATDATYQWVNCSNDYALIDGENDAEFIATANGSYAVIVNQGDCSDTSHCVSINSVGIFENEANSSVLIYPNPATTQFTVELNQNQSIIQLEVTDLTGSIIYSMQTTNTNQTQLYPTWAKGTYFISIQTENGNISTKKLQLN